MPVLFYECGLKHSTIGGDNCGEDWMLPLDSLDPSPDEIVHIPQQAKDRKTAEANAKNITHVNVN